MGTTVINGYTYPESTDQPLVPSDLRTLAEQVARGGIMRFASSADRTTSFTTLGISPSAGMMSYLTDQNVYESYDGTAWGSTAWASYTVSWTASGSAPAIGNGTLAGFFYKRDHTVFWRVRWLFGSTTTFGTGNYFFSLPVACVALGGMDWALGSGVIVDVSTQFRYRTTATTNTATTLWLNLGDNNPGVMQAAAPVTWANGDWGSVGGSYEAA